MDKPKLHLSVRAKQSTVKQILELAKKSGLSKSEYLRTILDKHIYEENENINGTYPKNNRVTAIGQ